MNARLLERLRGEIRRAETAGRTAAGNDGGRLIMSGLAGLDQLLPDGGYQPGSLVEWLAPAAGGGAELLGLLLARAAAQPQDTSTRDTSTRHASTQDISTRGISTRGISTSGTSTLSSSMANSSPGRFVASTARNSGAIVVIDPRGDFYPPAAARLGLRLEQLIVIRHQREEELYWAIEQALRSPAIAAVYAVASLGTRSRDAFLGSNLDERWLRRFQLAAEQGGGMGIFIRPLRVAGQPTWSDVQWRVEVTAGDLPGPGILGEVHSEVGFDSEARPAGENWLARGDVRGTGLALRVQLLRCRGGVAGQTLWLECDLESGQVRRAKRGISDRVVQADLAEAALQKAPGRRRLG